MKTVTTALVVIWLFSVSSYAEDTSRFEVHGGYSCLHTPVIDVLHGCNCGLTYYFSDFFGLEVDISGHYKGSVDFYNFLIGPKYVFNRPGNISPYVHALVGAGYVHDNWCCTVGNSWSETQVAFAMGAGLDIRLNKHVAIRPIQLDYIRQMGVLREHQARYTFGLVFRFGD